MLRKTSHANFRESQSSRVISENAAQGSNVTTNEANRRENKSSTTVYVDSNMSILLQTANASVSRIDEPHSAVTIRVLLDSGSQRSYISERAKEKLGLFPKRKEKLLIKLFGQENEDLRECGIVEFCVRGLSQSSGVQMTAHIVPPICSPLVNQAVQFAQQSYSHLVDLKLADQPSEDFGSEVDVLEEREDVENIFRFSKFLVSIFLFLFLSPLRTFLYSRAARMNTTNSKIPQISHSHQRTLTLILEN